MDLYFKRHDGQAVTCDDFLAAMADANGQDLSTVARWSAAHLPAQLYQPQQIADKLHLLCRMLMPQPILACFMFGDSCILIGRCCSS